MLARFPRRTVLLMLAALAAFARLWWVTHAPADAAEPGPPRVVLTTVKAGPTPTDAGAFP